MSVLSETPMDSNKKAIVVQQKGLSSMYSRISPQYFHGVKANDETPDARMPGCMIAAEFEKLRCLYVVDPGNPTSTSMSKQVIPGILRRKISRVDMDSSSSFTIPEVL